jgi:hypothetical protein
MILVLSVLPTLTVSQFLLESRELRTKALSVLPTLTASQSLLGSYELRTKVFVCCLCRFFHLEFSRSVVVIFYFI